MGDVCVLNIRKARKSHICYECDGTIQRDERYFYYSGIWESKPASFKVCVDCDALRDHMEQDLTYDDERICFGDLISSLSDYDDCQELYIIYAEIKMKRGGKFRSYILEEIMENDPLYGHCLVQYLHDKEASGEILLDKDY